jgi:hypothetical protein
MSKAVFRVPVTWEVYGLLEVEAETLEEAVEMVKRDEDQNGEPFDLPTDSDYVEGSFRLSEGYSVEEIRDLFNR